MLLLQDIVFVFCCYYFTVSCQVSCFFGSHFICVMICTDCIGSAFNNKGVMQCPNCEKIEEGQWLYANGSRPLPEFSMDDWAYDEDLYGLSYSEMVIGTHILILYVFSCLLLSWICCNLLASRQLSSYCK